MAPNSIISAMHLATAVWNNQRVEHYRISAGDSTADATAYRRNLDYRVDVMLEGYQYTFGRNKVARWRRTPAGVVRIIRSDVQGDALDRWPSAVFGFSTTDCVNVGEASQPAPSWVLRCKSAGDVPHWYFVEQSDGRIIREVSREGSQVVTYDLDTSGGWTTTGSGGTAHVRLVSATAKPIDMSQVEIPLSATNPFDISGNDRVQLRPHFNRLLQIVVPVHVNGRTLRFLVDTGTTQILMDVGAATRAGLKPSFGHVIAPQVKVGSAIASNLPIETVDLFNDSWDGVLGSEFFSGHIVFISYWDQRLELISPSAFVVPNGAHEIDAYCDEGMPLVGATVGSATSERFAIDTGSFGLLLSKQFASRASSSISLQGRDSAFDFLEGTLHARTASVRSLSIANIRFKGTVAAYVASPLPTDLDIPLDGIVGTNVLGLFDWWFDYDHNRLWFKYRG